MYVQHQTKSQKKMTNTAIAQTSNKPRLHTLAIGRLQTHCCYVRLDKMKQLAQSQCLQF